MYYEDLKSRIQTATGVTGRSSRDSINFRHGNAYVTLSKESTDTSVKISYRKEGEGTIVDRTHVTLSADDAVALAVEVLSTGRTCEVGEGVGLRSLGYEMPSGGVDIPWRTLAEYVRFGRDRHSGDPYPLNLNPDYQRGSVWDEKRQRRFIGHCLEGGKTNPLYVYRDPNYVDLTEEVIDGQQRLRAITAFIFGEIPGEVYIPGEGWRELWYRDFNEVDRMSHRLSCRVIYGDWNRKERMEFYLRLNAGGVVHTEEELDKVRKLLVQEG
tara:strand:- start:1622 stop:2428 length:807 start_codon:yes stop_codon:yes gene_type:complete